MKNNKQIKAGTAFLTHKWKLGERIELITEALREPRFDCFFGLVVDHTLVDNIDCSYWNENTQDWEAAM